MTDTQHTPTPWEQVGQNISDGDCGEIASTADSSFSYDADLANAAHIVKCVNMHDELVEALARISKVSRGSVSDDTLTSSVNRLNAAIDIAYEALKKAGAL